MRRRSGRPSASFMRSAIGMVWSCHGASPSSPSPAGPCSTAAPCSADSGVGAIGRQQPGKEAVQPGALRFGERRAGGNDLDLGRRCHLVHEETSASASLRSVSPSWRRAKVRNVSSGEARLRDIGLQQPLDRTRRILRLDVVKHLLPDIGVRTKAAAGEEMKALDGVVAVADRDCARRSGRCR